jgi:hypothetical protein
MTRAVAPDRRIAARFVAWRRRVAPGLAALALALPGAAYPYSLEQLLHLPLERLLQLEISQRRLSQADVATPEAGGEPHAV